MYSKADIDMSKTAAKNSFLLKAALPVPEDDEILLKQQYTNIVFLFIASVITNHALQNRILPPLSLVM